MGFVGSHMNSLEIGFLIFFQHRGQYFQSNILQPAMMPASLASGSGPRPLPSPSSAHPGCRLWPKAPRLPFLSPAGLGVWPEAPAFPSLHLAEHICSALGVIYLMMVSK